jgi:hypothetical protein
MKRFKPSDKVVCINDDFSNIGSAIKDFQNLPIKGMIYTIREIRPAAMDSGIMLNEITNKPVYYKLYAGYLEPGFSPKRFVPLDEYENIAEEKKVEELEICFN